MINYKLGRDRNGNRVLKVQPVFSRGFSIQTNGNLPKTDADGIGVWTLHEVTEYVQNYGTNRQQRVMGIINHATK